MGKGNSMRLIVVAVLAAVSVAAAAQQSQNQAQTNQNQNQNQNQPQSQQAQPQNQQAQPQQKKSFWQKVKDATQQGQNTMQQGQNTVQQVSQPGQSGSQQVQNGQQQMQNGMQQMQNGTQQMQNGGQMQGGQQGGQSLYQGNGAFSGGGGGAGACGQSCFDAGPFQANVSQMTMSQELGWHVIRMTFQFHNSTNQPLTIAYKEGSMVMVDNNGNTYIPAGGNPGELQGMGIDRGTQTDSQFVLAPGQTGNALFSVARGRPNTSPIGTSYSYNLTIDELQPQNGAMAIAVRTYNLNFPSLAPGTSNASFTSGGSPANSYAAGARGAGGNAVPQNNMQTVTGQPAAAGQQQRVVNGKAVPATPASVVNNAAIRTSMTTNTTAPKPATSNTSAAKPVPTAATTKPTTATKKPAATTPANTQTTTPATK